jgi:hypothetical protein
MPTPPNETETETSPPEPVRRVAAKRKRIQLACSETDSSNSDDDEEYLYPGSSAHLLDPRFAYLIENKIIPAPDFFFQVGNCKLDRPSSSGKSHSPTKVLLEPKSEPSSAGATRPEELIHVSISSASSSPDCRSFSSEKTPIHSPTKLWNCVHCSPSMAAPASVASETILPAGDLIDEAQEQMELSRKIAKSWNFVDVDGIPVDFGRVFWELPGRDGFMTSSVYRIEPRPPAQWHSPISFGKFVEFVGGDIWPGHPNT